MALDFSYLKKFSEKWPSWSRHVQKPHSALGTLSLTRKISNSNLFCTFAFDINKKCHHENGIRGKIREKCREKKRRGGRKRQHLEQIFFLSSIKHWEIWATDVLASFQDWMTTTAKNRVIRKHSTQNSTHLNFVQGNFNITTEIPRENMNDVILHFHYFIADI